MKRPFHEAATIIAPAKLTPIAGGPDRSFMTARAAKLPSPFAPAGGGHVEMRGAEADSGVSE
jgi:hypothetical protein